MSCLVQDVSEAGIRPYAEAGFRAAEVPAYQVLDVGTMLRRPEGFWWRELSEADRHDLKRRLSVFDCVTVHAAHQELCYFSINPHVRDESLSQIYEAIDCAERLGGSVVTIHIMRKPRVIESEAFDEMVALYRQFGDYAGSRGVMVGLENASFPFTAEYYLDLVAACDHPAVGATLDVGHVACWFDRTRPATEAEVDQYNVLLEQLVRGLGDRLVHVHLHDVDRETWKDHKAPGTGIVDCRRLLSNLHGSGYKRQILLEYATADIQERIRHARRFGAMVGD